MQGFKWMYTKKLYITYKTRSSWWLDRTTGLGQIEYIYSENKDPRVLSGERMHVCVACVRAAA